MMAAFLVVTAVYATGAAQSQTTAATTTKMAKTGLAAWYGKGFEGKPTASGEIYSSDKLTAAHRTLPFGTLVRVTNLKNGKTVDVRVNDRGPFSRKRIIDISEGAARLIGLKRMGIAEVRIEVIEYP